MSDDLKKEIRFWLVYAFGVTVGVSLMAWLANRRDTAAMLEHVSDVAHSASINAQRAHARLDTTERLEPPPPAPPEDATTGDES